MMASNPWREGFEAIMFRTLNDQPTLWDSIMPPELLVLPVELGRVDALLDDPVFLGRSPRTSMPGSGGRRSRWKPICG
jgi:hypothetical protein